MLGCMKIFIFTITIFFIVNYLIFENLVPKELILNYILEKFNLKIPHFPTIPKTIILENNDQTNLWKFTHFNQTHYETINEKNLLENVKIFNDNLEKIQGGNINLIYNCIVLIFSFKEESIAASNVPTIITIPMAKNIVYEFLSELIPIPI